MNIISKIKNYSVSIEQDFGFTEELLREKNAHFVIDKNVYELYKDIFSGISDDRLTVIEAIEQNKVIDTALEICLRMTEISAKRNAVLISFGGGVIQDITGFAANILYRGVKWIFVPTTLLAACDSCIGGKTSLNFRSYKNLLGTFYPPDEIRICPLFFRTLTDRDYKSGLGEVIKFNIMAGQSGLDRITSSIEGLLKRESELVSDFMKTSLEFKKRFVEEDEFDRGERIKLNFAHTFGHAVEVVSEYEIPHGTAVAIGMIMADRVSFERGILSEKIMSDAQKVLLKVIDIDLQLLNVPVENIISAMSKDKKQIGNGDGSIQAMSAVLMTDYSERENLILIHDLKISEIENAVQYFKNLYKNIKE